MSTDSNDGFHHLKIQQKLNSSSLQILLEAWRGIITNNSNKNIVLLKGVSDNFCEGFDLEQIVQKGNTEALTQSIQRFAGFIKQLAQSHLVTIALVKGAARGARLGLVSACDFVLASKGATFQLPEGLFGLLPGIILPFLANKMTLDTVKKMYISAQAITSAEAARLGLVDLITDSFLDDAARQFVKSHVRCGKEELQMFKRFVGDHYLQGLVKQLAVGTKILIDKMNCKEIKQRVEDFVLYGLLSHPQGDERP